MRLSLILTLFAALVGSIAAQSGRAKPTPTPTPRRIDGPSVVYTPTSTPAKKPAASPTPVSRPDDDVIKVDSALVPIPASVLDERGRTNGNLTLADFELRIDGKTAEISDLTRSESPIRLAMLFDKDRKSTRLNSSYIPLSRMPSSA